jgi:hypothetical protein
MDQVKGLVFPFHQGCGSGLNLDSIGFVYPDLEYILGVKRKKMKKKSSFFLAKFIIFLI